MNKYEKALNNVRKFEREHNMSKFGDVVPQPNSDTLQELVDKEHRSKELYDKNIELKQENQKLKEAINILKDFFIIHQKNSDYLITATGFDKLSQMDYELLKRVFESAGGDDE